MHRRIVNIAGLLVVTSWVAALGVIALPLVTQAAPKAEVTPRQKEEARQYFTEGSRAFDRKEYAAAIASFQKAYEIIRSPEIIYNIGRCYEELGQVDDALYHYEMYLRFYPTAADAEDTRHRIAMLQELKRSGAAPGTATTSPAVAGMEDLTQGSTKKKDQLDRVAVLEALRASKARMHLGFGLAGDFGSGDHFNANKFAFLPLDVGATVRLTDKLGAFLDLDYARYAEGTVTVETPKFPERRIGAVVGLRWLVPVGKLAVDVGVGGFAEYMRFNHTPHPGWFGGRLTGGISVPISAKWSFLTSALFSLGVLASSERATPKELQGEAGARFGFEYAF